MHTTRAACVGTGLGCRVCSVVRVWAGNGAPPRGKGHLTKAKDYLTTHMSQAKTSAEPSGARVAPHVLLGGARLSR